MGMLEQSKFEREREREIERERGVRMRDCRGEKNGELEGKANEKGTARESSKCEMTETETKEQNLNRERERDLGKKGK